jgi:gamma-glutamyl:cysteine ligase YbdK (ATP-grasp superfamily)
MNQWCGVRDRKQMQSGSKHQERRSDHCSGTRDIPMTAKHIEKILQQTLLHDAAMHYGLYEYELEELLDELTSSLLADQDNYIFAVTANSGHVAMVLIEQSGQVYINEQAREQLQALWPVAYTSNMTQLIPAFAQQLHQGELPINGVKTVGQS